ncbi:MAG TPA: ABC transporter permease [Verrucomicrobiae bacterium]|nr:ABC transporter permease [Verrucomicrobiae bacterium]
MTNFSLILRSLRFHARAHLGVLLGAIVGSAALVGALIVGDSVRISLHDLALARLGKVEFAMASNDRLFREQLAADIPGGVGVLELPGIASTSDGSARANHVQILGVNEKFWPLANQPAGVGVVPADTVVLNSELAQQLRARVGDDVLLRVQKPSLLSRDAVISPQNDLSVAWRVKIHAIISDEQLGRFGLQASQVAPFNAFVNVSELAEKIGQTNRANLLLVQNSSGQKPAADTNAVNQSLAKQWQLDDAELELRELPDNAGVELRSRRVFLDPAAVTAAQEISSNAQPVLTYFVNELRSPPFATPYSMVAAMGAPVVPADMRDDEILVNSWLADDLSAKPGDPLTLTYYVIGNGRALEERQEEFHVRGVVPMTGAAADRGLMPDFPGIAEADSSSDWDAGFPIQLKRIRPKDEQYWKQFRGTPKAFITLAAGKNMWTNRFGKYTAMRFPPSAGSVETIRRALLQKISPASLGFVFQPVREQALVASSQAVDFGGLFIGFSFFLIAAALLLMGLLFQFGLEQRATEIGTLLALGFRPRQVRRLFLGEGALLALAGGIIGALGGIIYARAMLLGLSTIWRGAVGTSALQYHATAQTLIIGMASGTIVSIITIWLTLRKQARRPARELLAQGAEENLLSGKRKRSWGIWIGPLAVIGAAAMILPDAARGVKITPDTFFSAGSLLLIGGLAFCAVWLAGLARRQAKSVLFSLRDLGLRACGRRRKRSLATIGLLACGVFLIVAIGAFRVDARADAQDHASGTGGFEFIGESAFPVTYDLNSHTGREFYGLDVPLMKNVRAISFRVHDGDEASCLNLNRAVQPRLLGVNAARMQTRGAFTFAEVMKGLQQNAAWGLLYAGADNSAKAADEIPAIGDENSIVWAMGKKVGDTVDYTDEHGRPFKVRLVGALANSVLQGNLIIDEADFVKKFPGESGYRMFLLDAPSNQAKEISALLTRALQDQGLELTPAVQRLNAYNAVQNTYLSTFQILGGLGLLLGSVGLGVVVLRNVQERRGELALLLAVGFRRRDLFRLVMSEHGALLALGLIVGMAAAVLGVLPALLSPGSQIPYTSLALTLAAVLTNGLLWTWIATRLALRGRLLDALRNE